MGWGLFAACGNANADLAVHFGVAVVVGGGFVAADCGVQADAAEGAAAKACTQADADADTIGTSGQ